ncbi:hypothetical protein, partial [Bacillus pseudomycoides]|uniref:hypothetical protein n=1 Tax=Bacillus pseudomycoides TaxID=64104 RepID=UPI002FFE0412
ESSKVQLKIPKWGSVRKMRIYNVKEISILKSLISQFSQFNAKKLGFFHYSKLVYLNKKISLKNAY